VRAQRDHGYLGSDCGWGSAAGSAARIGEVAAGARGRWWRCGVDWSLLGLVKVWRTCRGSNLGWSWSAETADGDGDGDGECDIYDFASISLTRWAQRS